MGLNTCSRPTATRPASISYISALISISSTCRWKLARTTKSFKTWVGAAVWEKGREHWWSVALSSDRCEYLASKEMKGKVNLFLDGLQLPNCVSHASFSDKTKPPPISLVYKLENSVAFKKFDFFSYCGHCDSSCSIYRSYTACYSSGFGWWLICLPLHTHTNLLMWTPQLFKKCLRASWPVLTMTNMFFP